MPPVTFHQLAILPVLNGLKNAHAFINKGYQHALSNSIDPNEYLSAALCPDMLDFRKQVDRFTGTATSIAPRVNPAIEGVRLPDAQQTFTELLERIDASVKYLEALDPQALEGRQDEEVIMRFKNDTLETRYTALNYVTQFAHPNFWFHVTTAYDILRYKGVDVGKQDFVNGAGLFTIRPVAKSE